MKLGKLLKAQDRKTWRAWLRKHHTTAAEAWLVYARKHSGRARISYNDAVEEALCFGWIDSIVKKVDANHTAQRFTPRRNPKNWSPHNIERMRRLIREKKMTPAGLSVYHHGVDLYKAQKLVLSPDVRRALKKDPVVWKHFSAFPLSYTRVRIAGIEHFRTRGKDAFLKRLDVFIKKTKANKRYGFGFSE